MPQMVFESTEVEFDLPFSSPITVNGWRILSLTYPMVTFWFSIAFFYVLWFYVAKLQISKVAVQQFQPGIHFPVCNIELQWVGEGQPKPLFHRFTLLGAKAPWNVCFIRYYPQTAGMSSYHTTFYLYRLNLKLYYSAILVFYMFSVHVNE